ncbi:MAG: response regulator [Planctomycetes bacterium]|nr:response regulator [Planctomycetota bacterium]MBL7043464.1 response regulator [Pirellulaceae bacterium]
MSDEPLIIHLSKRVVENIKIAHFPVRGTSQAASIVRRAKRFGALATLDYGQWANLGKCTSEVCRQCLSIGVTGTAEFWLTRSRGRNWAEIRLCEESSDTAEKGTEDSTSRIAAHQTELRSLAGLVPRFEVVEQSEGAWSVRFAETIPPDFTMPTPDEVLDWAAILRENSAEGSLAVCSARFRDRFSKTRGERSEAAIGSTEESDDETVETLQLLSVVARNTDSSVAILDADGTIVWANEAFSRLTGYSEAESLGHKLDEILFGDDTDATVLRDYRQLMHNGLGSNEERLQVRLNGQAYWSTFNLSPIHNQEGQVTRWVAIGSDTSVRRNAEDALATSRDVAEAASRAKSEFLANMSHEIRTPMNAIIGMTELALGTSLTREQQEYLATVKVSAESLLQLLNDILDLSRIEAGRLEIEEIDFNLADLLRDSMQALSVQADAKGLELIWHLPMDVPQALRGDPVRLRQVLVNLVGNAVKFTEHGEVVVDADKQWQSDVEVSLSFSVRDTGIGIPRERLEKIFDAFTQVDASTTRKYGGTGLGLAITAELLKLMHGRIRVESTLGQGSTFHFTLPFRLAEDRTVEHKRAAPEDIAGMPVLVVDDNTTNRRILQEFLSWWGFRPQSVDGAEAALEAMQAASDRGEPFSLVLLDVCMPRIDGFELAERIKRDSRMAAATIMMLSSADRYKDAQRCRALGISTYLTKPVSPDSLLDTILVALGKAPAAPTVHAAPGVEAIDAPPRILRILVADDHAANRDLAAKILGKRGHHIAEAKNGQEVLQRLASEPYDIVLMDVQMPEMDGLQATVAIRDGERETGEHLPIIALTACAMKGDRERFLAGGMDAYLAKPLRAKELVTLVETLTSASPVSNPPIPTPPRTDAPGDNFACAMERLDGDAELLKEQMACFVDDGPHLLREIDTALPQQDIRKLESAAHRLGSQLAGFDRPEAAEIAYKLEQMCIEGPLDGAEDMVRELTERTKALVGDIRRFLDES